MKNLVYRFISRSDRAAKRIKEIEDSALKIQKSSKDRQKDEEYIIKGNKIHGQYTKFIVFLCINNE